MSVQEIMGDENTAREDAGKFVEAFNKVKAEVSKMMVGQEDVIDGVLTAMFAGGHVLLEGVPGLGKTMLVRTISEAVNLKFSRIQFTPDMMPSDIQGTTVLTETASGGHELTFQEGPLISNLVLADEINRATPKTQSALLEAMQEKQVTVGRRTIKMEEPYCVMATQNPVEQEGTYPLPEAQLDRFLFKLVVGYPTEADYHGILDRTTGSADTTVTPVTDGATLMRLRSIARAVPVPQASMTYAIRLIMGTQPGNEYSPEMINTYSALGSSPRGAQGMMLAGKVAALLAGRFAVSTDDLRSVAKPILRHRIVANYRAQADNVSTDDMVDAVLKHVKPPRDVS